MLEIELAYDPAIPLVYAYFIKPVSPRYTHNPISMAKLFTIAKTWN